MEDGVIYEDMDDGIEENVLYASLEDGNDIEVVGLNIDLDSNPISKVVEFIADNEKEVIVKRKQKFTCLICTRKFSQNAGRYNHMKKVHNICPGEKANVRCLEEGCLFTCSYKEKLQLHLSEVHGIVMDVTTKTFDCSQDFFKWKDEFERQEKSRFVKKSGSRIREEGIRVGYYYCSRSGTYVSHSKGIKNSKKKGTSKSSHHCTASITCVELPDGKIEVKICSTHYGHQSELQHLRLTQTEKFKIAAQLARGVPRDLVLDNVHASTGSDVDRIHLITIKDVKNIEKAYGLHANSNEKTNDMYCNLNVWIANIMATEHCPVLYFNEKGVVNNKNYDLTLILLTPGQVEVLNKYARSGIFYVYTCVAKNKQSIYYHPLRPSVIYVTTLMIVDDLNEAVPVSFMLTNNSDTSKFKIFFESLKKKVPVMSARAVLTDDRKEVFGVWCSVFNEEPYHLWSNRFVDNDWREHLICILDEEVQVCIYERLYSFLESSDRDKLETSLDSYVYELQSNVVTNKFGDYLASKYIGAEGMWAGCYGKRSVSINAQLNMEMVCNEIDDIGHKKHWDKNFLVRTVQHLLKLISEKQCIRQTKIQRQLQELSTHHNLALNIKSEAISEESDTCWRVDSVKDPKTIFSYVNRGLKCESNTCVLYCSKCNICAHEFQCSCKVHTYDRTMCKHIHAVAINLITQTKAKIEPTNGNECSGIMPQCDERKEIKSPNLVLLKGNLWRKGNESKKRKKKAVDTTLEENLLPVIEEVLHNKHIAISKRKRGRPRKQSEEKVPILDKKPCASSKDHDSSSSVNTRLQRINILRKTPKKCF